MHPVNDLKRLLSRNIRQTGTVVNSNLDTVTVATSKGVVSVKRLPGDATLYRNGDTAVLLDGQVIGRRRGSPSIYVV